MSWPAKPSMSARDDHQLTVILPSGRRRDLSSSSGTQIAGVFPYALSLVLVMYSTYAAACSVLTQPAMLGLSS